MSSQILIHCHIMTLALHNGWFFISHPQGSQGFWSVKSRIFHETRSWYITCHIPYCFRSYIMISYNTAYSPFFQVFPGHISPVMSHMKLRPATMRTSNRNQLLMYRMEVLENRCSTFPWRGEWLTAMSTVAGWGSEKLKGERCSCSPASYGSVYYDILWAI